MSEIILSILCLVELYVIIQLVNRLLVKSGVAPLELPKREEERPEAEAPRKKKLFSVAIQG